MLQYGWGTLLILAGVVLLVTRERFLRLALRGQTLIWGTRFKSYRAFVTQVTTLLVGVILVFMGVLVLMGVVHFR